MPKQIKTTAQGKSKANSRPKDQLSTEKQTPQKFIVDIAGSIKFILQVVVALGIIGLLTIKVLYRFDVHLGFFNTKWFHEYLESILNLPTLVIVSKSLAYSAGIDLAYMLLTPGPDEAIEPLILGLASAILFSISSIGGVDTKITLALEVGLYVITLAGLFALKERFIKDNSLQNGHGLINLFLASIKYVIKEIKTAVSAFKEIRKMVKP